MHLSDDEFINWAGSQPDWSYALVPRSYMQRAWLLGGASLDTVTTGSRDGSG